MEPILYIALAVVAFLWARDRRKLRSAGTALRIERAISKFYKELLMAEVQELVDGLAGVRQAIADLVVRIDSRPVVGKEELDAPLAEINAIKDEVDALYPAA